MDEEIRKILEKEKFIRLSETQFRCDWIYDALTDAWFHGSFI